jgi:hypothetical protein
MWIGPLSACGLSSYDSCDSIHETFNGVLEEESSIAVYVSSGDRVSGESAGGYVRGYLLNLDEAAPCATATYRFEGMPTLEDIPILDGREPPAVSPSGEGHLMNEQLLPVAGSYERRYAFMEQLSDEPLGDASIDRTFVVVVCPQPQVKFELFTSLGICLRGEDEPPPRDPGTALERLW